MSPSAGTGTQNPVLTITSPAHTALTASTEHNSLNFNLSATVQFATGAITTLRAFRIQAPTYSFQGASTVTNAAALQIDSAPVAGTNATLTETAALRVLTGTTVGKGVVVRGAASQTGNLFEAQNSTPTTIWNISAAGNETISPAASTGTQSPELTITGPAHTALTASTEFNDVNFNFARTVQFATGAITTLRAFRIQAPTYGFQGASTVTNAATLQIDSAPIVGTNATLTESAALRVLTGADAAKGVVIRANSGTQSGNLFEVQNSTGTAQVAVSGAGSLVIGTASGALSASSGTVSVGTLSIGNGGTNTTSFATSNGVVYYDGTRLVTTNATASGILVTNASNVPSTATDIPTAVTIGGSYVYRAGGTDVALADGGTNASLTGVAGGVVYSTASAMAITTAGSSGQPLLSGGSGAPSFGTLGMGAGGTGLTTTAPGANYVLGMNASNNGLEYKQLVQGSNITITHAANQVTITASGGSASPGGSNTQIQYNAAGALGGISNFTFVSPLLSVTNATNFGTTSTAGLELKYSTAAGTTTVNNNSPAMDFIGRLYASASDRNARIRQEIQTTAATPAHAMVWSSSYDTGTASYTKVLSLHSVDGLGFWNYAGTPGSFANYFKTGNQASDIRYTWPTTAPTTNQVLSASAVSGADITLSWATAGGGSGTVGSGTANQLAYYSGATTTASDASLVRSATGTHLTITAQGATTSPLKVVGAASQSAALFTVATSGADVLVVGSAGAITTGTWNGTAIGVLYGGTGQTTYTDGQLLIGNSTGNTLTKATLTAGNGIAVTNGSGSISVRTKRVMNIQLASGFNPPVGADTAVIRIPESPTDGSSSVTYNVRRLTCRVETPSSGTSTFQVEYYTGTSAFSATNLLSSALSVTGATTYEFSSTGFSTSTLATGAKIRLNFSAVDTTHANFSINLLLEEN
jgi:hypothetical protein